jgi:hypothetical protein|tara:strand:+ start:2835 stop:3170 length:336 start_codon:yes stop_codon:yes gene_type:complete
LVGHFNLLEVLVVNEVDPSALTAADWDQVTVTLSFIWAFFGAQVSAALNFTLAHAFIPSLVTTGHIPKAANKVRPFFYGATVAFAMGAVWSMVNFINASEVLRNIYPRVWV